MRGALNPVVGARLKSQVKVVAEAVKNLSIDELEEYVKANLVPEDPICVVISTASTNIHKVVQSHASLIDATVKQPIVCCDAGASAEAAAKNALQSASASIGRLAIEDEASVSSSTPPLPLGLAYLLQYVT
ncbi:unnamed protein product [Schistocephalus solidus]|uniref:Uncharacterized protein n=1 Tax=Schistocephalus solidus TaxID=70667 RepID=A0A3P7D6E8_SCHSO|nr:unnamed protein product [Schistocephalus solidus]